MMRTMLFAIAALAACDGYAPPFNQAPFYCGTAEPRCPNGYTCEQANGDAGAEICVAPNGSIPVDALFCNADINEPNDTLAKAMKSTVDSAKSMTIDNVAICPSGDRDLYEVDITTAGENVDMIVEFAASGAQLEGAILNAGGVPLAMTAPVEGVPTASRAFVANLSVGAYYVQVYDLENGVNNYKVSVTVTGP